MNKALAADLLGIELHTTSSACGGLPCNHRNPQAEACATKGGKSVRAEAIHFLQQALLVLFRASHAMPRPGNGLQPLLLKFLFALDAAAVRIGLNARQRPIDQSQHGSVRIGLSKEEFL